MIQRVHERDQLRLGRRRRQVMLEGFDAAFRTGLSLAPDVDGGRGILANLDYGEPRRAAKTAGKMTTQDSPRPPRHRPARRAPLAEFGAPMRLGASALTG